ncbi:thioesterase [Niabella ginsenosidivorans]|uniref:Thioesterase n=1 Tax=Niabella ginsenosidivorans TaxID=1176587 RepID=A0A1A9I8H0_9BACT|nr:thioesterase [Niabella ginsenosidivorans]
MKHPVKFRMFLLSKLPLALLAGVRIREIDDRKCMVTVPYNRITKNPFRSTYFAALAMAGELSTGALAMAKAIDQPAKISLLVVKLEATYFKKATGITFFTCKDGVAFSETIQKAIKEDQPQQLTAVSTGESEAGELIATFHITWSFKAKNKALS